MINDRAYREEKANIINACIMSVDSFNKIFKEESECHKTIIPFKIDDQIGEIAIQTKKKISYHNDIGEYQMRLVALSGLNHITCRLTFLVPFLKRIGPKVRRVISDRGAHFNRV